VNGKKHDELTNLKASMKVHVDKGYNSQQDRCSVNVLTDQYLVTNT